MKERLFNALIVIASLTACLLSVSAAAPVETKLRGVMVHTDVSTEDLAVLALWKVNLIRWPMVNFTTHFNEYSSFTEQDRQNYLAWLDGRLAHLDKILPECGRHGIKVVIDLHTPPGSFLSKERGEMLLFKNRLAQHTFVEVWRRVARRVATSPVVWGLDLLNEPGFRGTAGGLRDWQSLAQHTAEEIRKIDSRHKIIVESVHGSPSKIEGLRPLRDVRNVVYSVHMYKPLDFTHQGLGERKDKVSSYPDLDKDWNKEKLRRWLKAVRDFQERYDVPIFIGEFSAVRWAPGESAHHYLRDLIEIFEGYKWDWTYHAFREADCWSVEHGDGQDTRCEAEPTGRQCLLRHAFARNR
jgi:endoglucanase